MTLGITFYDGIKYKGADFIARDSDIIGNGVVSLTDWPVTFPATPDMTVNVGHGRAWVDGFRVTNDSTVVSLTIQPADPTNPRIDLIQVGHDDINLLPSLVVKAGVPAAEPFAPGADPGYVGLWQISVPANATSITNTNMTDIRKLMPLNVDGSQLVQSGSASLSQTNIFTAVQEATGWVATDAQTPLQIPMLSQLPTAIGAANTLIVVDNGGLPSWYRSDGTQWVDMGSKLTPATSSVLGGVIVGQGLTVAEDGTLSATAAQADYYNFTATAGQSVINLPAGKTYSPGTNTMHMYIGGRHQDLGVVYTETSNTEVSLAGWTFAGGEDVELAWFTQVAANAPLAPATNTTLGGIKGSSTLSIAADGTASVLIGPPETSPMLAMLIGM